MATTALLSVGTYTTLRSARLKALGIYTYAVDLESGALALVHQLPKVTNPSYLAFHPRGDYLYAVIDVATTAGRPGGSVSAFAIDPVSGAPRYLNNQLSHGLNPCHLSVDQSGRFLLVANYGSGTVAMFPIERDGWIGPASDVVHHQGSSVDRKRQSGPHPHAVTVDPGNRFAHVPDLGLDRILSYRLDLERGKLVPNERPGASVAAGAGLRHLVFHPTGPFAFVLNELASTIGVFSYDETTGILHEIETRSTVPARFSGANLAAALHVAPSGQFLFASNRGHDSIASFAIDQQNGRLTELGWNSTLGRTPRDFAIDPSGSLLLVANQDSCTIVAFSFDAHSGQLRPTEHPTDVPTPVCLKFPTEIHTYI